MNNKQGLCQIQGHERVKLSYICVSHMCEPTFRLMCIECVNKNLHNHDVELYKCFTEFEEYFKNSRLPQLKFRLEQQKGNQAKCDFHQKIYEEFSQLEQEINQSDLKQQDESIEDFCKNIIMVKQAILDFIIQLKNEIAQAQNIYEAYGQLTLDNINEFQIKLLLENNCQFFEKENQSLQEIQNIIDKFNLILIYPNQEFLKNGFSKLKQLSMKLQKLNRYINFHKYDKFSQGYQPFRDQISESGRYFAQQFTNNRKGQDRLYIRNLISKKVIQQHFFKCKVNVRVKFDKIWKYFVSFQDQEHSYNVRGQQIKVIRKFQSNNSISQIKFTNLNNIMITTVGKEQQIQIIDFQLRITNIYSGHPKKNYHSLLYGEERNIIVTLLHDDLHKTDCIFIYKESEIKPFIVCNHLKKHENRERFQVKLFNKDSQLLTTNELIINSWQIDYVNKNLILTKTIEDKIHLRDQYQLQNIYIIKKSKKNSSHIEIMDQNFNLWFTIQLKTLYYYADHIHISNQTLLYTDQGEYIVLTRARSDYEQLEQ